MIPFDKFFFFVKFSPIRINKFDQLEEECAEYTILFTFDIND